MSTDDEQCMEYDDIVYNGRYLPLCPLSDEMMTVLDSARGVINTHSHTELSEFEHDRLLRFSYELEIIAKGNCEILNRRNAIFNFFEEFKKKLCCKYRRKAMYTQNIFDFAKRMIKGFRFTEQNKDECDDIEYTLDIALKTNNLICTEYKDKMHELLSKYTMDIVGITELISMYSENGYKWYNLTITSPEDQEKYKHKHWKEESDGNFMYDFKYDEDDYFRDNSYYKKKEDERMYHKKTTIQSLRNELDQEQMNKVSDKEFAGFIAAVSNLCLGFSEWDLYSDSIIKDSISIRWISKQLEIKNIQKENMLTLRQLFPHALPYDK